MTQELYLRLSENLSKVHSSIPIKAKSGKLLVTKQQAKRWAEHLSKVVNQPNPTDTLDLSNEMNNLVENTDITIDNIAMDWLHRAIKVLQNNKARGIYRISAGLLKHGEDIIIEKLNEIEIVIWYTGQTLSE